MKMRLLILRRKHLAGIELQVRPGDVRALLQRRRREFRALVLAPELRIGSVALMTVRIAEVAAPALGAWFSSSAGMSSPIMSRPCSLNHSSPVRGSQSKPTVLRMPRA